MDPGDLAAPVRVPEVDRDQLGMRARVVFIVFGEIATRAGHLGCVCEAVETGQDRAQPGVREVRVVREPPAAGPVAQTIGEIRSRVRDSEKGSAR